MAKERAPSETPIPSTEVAQPDGAASAVTEDEWKAMKTVLDNIYAHRADEYVERPLAMLDADC